MKKIILSALALLGMGTMANAQFSVYDQDGKVLFTMPTTPAYVDSQYQKPTTGTENGHDWVDLGLSVKWATMNVGATAPQEYGDFFAEGERRGAEYLWAKTTHEEAAKILPNYKKYIDTPGRWDRDALRDL